MADLEEWLAKRKGRTQGVATRSILRGDIQSQDLAEVLLQVIGTGEEGILRLMTPVDERDLYIADGKVQIFAPSRPGKRLGECMLHLGLLKPGELQEALKLQKILYQPLGVILLEKRFATQEAIDKVAAYQAREELYALFTWHAGRFDFFQEERQDPEMVARLQVMPSFECSEVLAEVDRRAGRWQRLLHSLASLDDVFAASGTPSPEGMTDDHRTLLGVLESGHTVREAADETVYSVFDCARLITDMLGWGVVKRLDAKGMLRVAAGQLAQAQPRRAVLTLQTLLDRGPDALPDAETALRVAEVLMETEAPRSASLALAHAARLCEEPNEALIRARRAYSLDDRCAEALRSLREILAVHGEDPEELFQVSCRLVEAASDEGSNEEAFSILDDLLAERPDDIDLLQRRARVMLRLDRKSEAAETLLVAARLVEQQGLRERATALYSQVLALDPKCRSASLAMLRLRLPLDKKQLKLVAFGAAGLLLLLIGLPVFIGSSEPVDAPPPTGTSNAVVQNRNRALIRQHLRRATESLRDHDLQAAVTNWREAQAKGGGKELGEAAQTAMAPVLLRLEELQEHLTALTAESEDPLEAARRRDQLLAEMKEEKHAEGLALARAIEPVRDDPLLVALLGAEDHGRLLRATDGALEALAAAEQIRQQHLRAMSLDPLIEKAIRHEEKYEFREAMEAYQRLLREHPGEGELLEHFSDRASRYERILLEMDEMNRAVSAFDFDSARKSLTRLQRLDPGIPFAKLTRLPLRVESRPAGARVLVNGEPAGETPARSTYAPDAKLRVEWQMAGFAPLALEFPPDRERVTAVLTKQPDWQAEIRGTLEQAPACDEDQVYVTDRTGGITALSSDTGKEIWSIATGDLSGLLPTPLVYEEFVLVASLDGKFRALDRTSGKTRWQKDGLPCEIAPALCGSTVMLCTDHGDLVGLEAGSGVELYRISLAARPVGRMRALDAERIVFVTNSGEAVCLTARDGSELWRTRVGRGCSQPPGVGEGRITAVSDDGRLVLLAASGSVKWQREGLLAPSAPPAIAGPFVLVPEGHLLRAYSVTDGEPGPQREAEKSWTAEPVAGAGHVLTGDGAGNVEVLDQATLELRYRIRGGSALRAAPAFDGTRRFVLAFEERQVLGFVRLP